MSKKLRRILTVVLAAVLAGSLGMLAFQSWQYSRGEKSYAEAEELVQLPDLSAIPLPQPSDAQPPAQQTPPPESTPTPNDAPPVSDGGETAPEKEPEPVYVDPYAEALRAMDFQAIRAANSDVLGWIVIPNTVLSYPLVQGEDNDYYLNRTWRGWYTGVGAIFMDYRCAADLSDFHTIIYGHRMRNGSMFASLKYYNSLSHWKNHPVVYLTDDSGSYAYEIFAAYEADAVGQASYQLSFADDGEKQAFIDHCLSQSVINTGVLPNPWDSIVTLSTCTGRGYETRWVVQAVRRNPQPEPPAEEPPAPEAPAAGEAAAPSA